jgi:hypothetical protein
MWRGCCPKRWHNGPGESRKKSQLCPDRDTPSYRTASRAMTSDTVMIEAAVETTVPVEDRQHRADHWR